VAVVDYVIDLGEMAAR